MSVRSAQPGKLPVVRCLVLTLLTIAAPLAGPAQERPAGQDSTPVQFRIDSDSSWLRVLVYRGGLLRGLGHNHVVSHRTIKGTVNVAQEPLSSTLDLEFDVEELLVDDPQQRMLAGPDFPGQIPEKDIVGTRANMLGSKLLQAAQFGSIQIRSENISGIIPDIQVVAIVTIKGTEFTVVFPARVEMSNDAFVASGELEIAHGDLGLKPFKAALGTLRVRDALVLQYEISGTRIRAPREIHFIL
jgi:polyisoprenoid-binding protein YceI